MARKVVLTERSAAGQGDLREWSDRVTQALEQGAQPDELETPQIRGEHFCDYFLVYCSADEHGLHV